MTTLRSSQSLHHSATGGPGVSGTNDPIDVPLERQHSQGETAHHSTLTFESDSLSLRFPVSQSPTRLDPQSQDSNIALSMEKPIPCMVPAQSSASELSQLLAPLNALLSSIQADLQNTLVELRSVCNAQTHLVERISSIEDELSFGAKKPGLPDSGTDNHKEMAVGTTGESEPLIQSRPSTSNIFHPLAAIELAAENLANCKTNGYQDAGSQSQMTSTYPQELALPNIQAQGASHSLPLLETQGRVSASLESLSANTHMSTSAPQALERQYAEACVHACPSASSPPACAFSAPDNQYNWTFIPVEWGSYHASENRCSIRVGDTENVRSLGSRIPQDIAANSISSVHPPSDIVSSSTAMATLRSSTEPSQSLLSHDRNISASEDPNFPSSMATSSVNEASEQLNTVTTGSHSPDQETMSLLVTQNDTHCQDSQGTVISPLPQTSHNMLSSNGSITSVAGLDSSSAVLLNDRIEFGLSAMPISLPSRDPSPFHNATHSPPSSSPELPSHNRDPTPLTIQSQDEEDVRRALVPATPDTMIASPMSIPTLMLPSSRTSRSPPVHPNADLIGYSQGNNKALQGYLSSPMPNCSLLVKPSIPSGSQSSSSLEVLHARSNSMSLVFLSKLSPPLSPLTSIGSDGTVSEVENLGEDLTSASYFPKRSIKQAEHKAKGNRVEVPPEIVLPDTLRGGDITSLTERARRKQRSVPAHNMGSDRGRKRKHFTAGEKREPCDDDRSQCVVSLHGHGQQFTSSTPPPSLSLPTVFPNKRAKIGKCASAFPDSGARTVQRSRHQRRGTGRTGPKHILWNGKVVSVTRSPSLHDDMVEQMSLSAPARNSLPETSGSEGIPGTTPDGSRRRSRRSSAGHALGTSSLSFRIPSCLTARKPKPDLSSMPFHQKMVILETWPKLETLSNKWRRQFIQCDNCELWFHYGCVGVKKGDPRLESEAAFICPLCNDQAVGGRSVREPTDACARPDCPEGVDEQDLYFVERLVGRKAIGKAGFLWLAKWDGYPTTQATWIPEGNIVGDANELFRQFENDAVTEGVQLKGNIVLLADAVAAGWKD